MTDQRLEFLAAFDVDVTAGAANDWDALPIVIVRAFKHVGTIDLHPHDLPLRGLTDHLVAGLFVRSDASDATLLERESVIV